MWHGLSQLVPPDNRESRPLLRETKRSVMEIALDVGYANPSHFAQLFRREAGLAPSDYRRQR
jgi:AraC family transcriptional regulator